MAIMITLEGGKLVPAAIQKLHTFNHHDYSVSRLVLHGPLYNNYYYNNHSWGGS